jgi:copper transport protein
MALLAALAIVASPGTVRAHAELTTSEPAANATLATSPEELRLSFTEPIDPELAFIDLLDAGQQAIQGLGPVLISEDGVTAGVTLPHLEPGIYTVAYQVVSTVDGHATAGIFAFVVDPTGTQAPPAVRPGATSPSVDAPTVAARWLALGGALVALGSLLLWWRARPVLGPAPLATAPWALVAVAAGLAFVGLAVYLTLAARPIVEAAPDRRLGIPFDFAAPFGWTPFAIAMRVALVGSLAACLLAIVARPRTGGRHEGTIVAVVTAATLVALGGMSMAAHAAAIGGPAFAALDWVHLVAVAAWLGGLPAVAVLARRRADDGHPVSGRGRQILRRHGRVALIAAPLVALTGLANSPLVLGDARSLVASEYGNLLLAKGTLLSVAVAIGAVNHFLVRGRERGRGQIAALVGVELIVAALAVSVAATMVTIQPAASRQPVLSSTPVNPAHLFGEAGPTSVHATVNLPAPGNQTYQVTVTDRETGTPRDDIQLVYLELVPPAGSGLADRRIPLTQDGSRPDLYATSGAYMSVEGDWTVSVAVRRVGALDESATFTVPVTQPDPPRLVPPPDTGVGVPVPLGVLWSVLPAGPVGWLPAVAALLALVALGVVKRGRPGSGMTLTRAALVGVVLVTALGAGSRALVAAANAPTAAQLAEHAPDPTAETSVQRGEALFLANCAACHGRRGEGDGPVRTIPAAGRLDEAVGRMSSAELSYRIEYGLAGTAMPAFTGWLTEAERRDLVTYLEDRWR